MPNLIEQAEKVLQEKPFSHLGHINGDWLMDRLDCTMVELGFVLTELVKRGKLTVDVANKIPGKCPSFTPENYFRFIISQPSAPKVN